MRLVILVLNILIGTMLLNQPAEVSAASVGAAAGKNTHLRGHATRLRGKSKKPRSHHHRVKQKKKDNPGDVWERMRSGMQIPRPNLKQKQPGLSLAQNNNRQPKITAGRTGHHILSGSHPQLSELNALILSDIRTGQGSVHSLRAQSKQSLVKKYNILSRHAALKPRIHAPIDRYSHLRKPGSKVKLIRTNGLAKKPITSGSVGLNGRNATTGLKSVKKQGNINNYRRSSPAMTHERINRHIVWYSQHRDYLHQVAERARPYLYHIVESLRKHKLPTELALLPIVESAYQPTAHSAKSAAGLWQFIPETGYEFDLEQNAQYDARLDIAASTHAAMRYLSFLKQHFNGDWLLALAAYNCGLGTVDAAIDRNNVVGLDTHYWSLPLPEETQEYVPRFLALSSIFANPAAYGLKLAPIKNEPYFIKVKIDSENDIKYLAEKDFSEIAQLADLSYEQFSRLNPGYLNSKLVTNGPFTLFMPIANAKQLLQRLASTPQYFDMPPVTETHTLLRRGALTSAYTQKTAFSLLSDIGLPTVVDLVAVSDPFLSLILNAGQTSPRIPESLLQLPLALAPDSKILKKKI